MQQKELKVLLVTIRTSVLATLLPCYLAKFVLELVQVR